MSTVTVVEEKAAQAKSVQRRRGCLFYVGRGLKWFSIVLILLVVLGVAYQTIATESDNRTYTPRGQLYTVNGHQMHIVCQGQGSPAVILQAGNSAESLWWHRIQTQLATHTRVCAYDRPGLGYSAPVAGLRNGLTIVNELHALLKEADIAPPYVMAGHSFGAAWTRIYAAQYPQEVAGIILVDSTMLPGQNDISTWKTFNNVVQVPLWAMWRTGLTRLLNVGDFQRVGYPPDIAREVAARQARNQTFDTAYAETIHAIEALMKEAAPAEKLGNIPMIVLWGSLSPTAAELLAPQREAMAVYSSNSVTRYIEGADHGSILGNERHAQQVSNAILDVIQAAQTGKSLAK